MVLWLSKLQLSSFDYQKKKHHNLSELQVLKLWEHFSKDLVQFLASPKIYPSSHNHGSVKKIGPSNSSSLSDTAIFYFDDCSTEDDYNWILKAEILIIEYSLSNFPPIPVSVPFKLIGLLNSAGSALQITL